MGYGEEPNPNPSPEGEGQNIPPLKSLPGLAGGWVLVKKFCSYIVLQVLTERLHDCKTYQRICNDKKNPYFCIPGPIVQWIPAPPSSGGTEVSIGRQDKLRVP
jgi:hypothetical protein